VKSTLFAAFLFAVLGGTCLNGCKRMTGADAAAYSMLGFASVFVCIVLLGIAALRYLWGM